MLDRDAEQQVADLTSALKRMEEERDATAGWGDFVAKSYEKLCDALGCNYDNEDALRVISELRTGTQTHS